MAIRTEPTPCAGLVLAGGRSSRMGRDKALLDWHGQPLIEHQIHTLEAAGADPVYVSGEHPGHPGIADRHPHKGPVGGLASAAEHLPDGYLLVVPVDMPRLQPDLLARLRQAPNAAPMIHFDHRVLPLRLLLDTHSRTVLADLMALNDDRHRSLRHLAARVGAASLPLVDDEDSQLADCNTPEQWKAVSS